MDSAGAVWARLIQGVVIRGESAPAGRPFGLYAPGGVGARGAVLHLGDSTGVDYRFRTLSGIWTESPAVIFSLEKTFAFTSTV